MSTRPSSASSSAPRRFARSGTRFVENRGRRYAVAPDAALPRVERRRSGLHGWGVFALERIPKNKRIIAYLGELVSHKESIDREARYLERGHIWCFKLSHRWVVDAGHRGNDARFINHSCAPNCYSQVLDGTIWIRAARAIEAGEELTYDYHTDGHGLITCLCRPGCRTRL